MKAAIELVAVILSVVAMVLAAFWFVEERHAARKELESLKAEHLETELEVRSKILDTDIKANAEARVYYKDIERDRGLEPPEQARLDYLENILERKYRQQELIQQRLMELED